MKKARRSQPIVTYVRMTPEMRARITEIVAQRGYPHTIASVAFEMIERGLKLEAPPQNENRQ